MCGIVGFRSPKDVSLDAMIASLAHRGPDDSGSFMFSDVGLGHTRLSILDIDSGHQPMFDPEGRVGIVYNGEIYNFNELKADLRARGITFKTNCDTEVLIYLYLIHGTDMLRYLNGMFAFCIYDKTKDIIFGARDRLGVKPFYYSKTSKSFFFASEIKALFASGHISKEMDPVALDHYFTFRYIPGERTSFKNVKKLRPAHAFILTADNDMRIWRYWDFKVGEGPNDFHSALERFEELLTDSVRLRLISDVPLGAFLSGGMDSTTIVGIMRKLGHNPLKTFTIGFGAPTDETDEAEISAKWYGCEHLSFRMPENSFELVPEALYFMDEPFADPIIVAIKQLSEKASRSVKVVLTGEGADEGQMGYVHHESLAKGLALGKRLPPFMLSLFASFIKRLPIAFLDKAFKYPSSIGAAGRERLARLFGVLYDPGHAYFQFISLFGPEEKSRLFGPFLQGGMEEASHERDEWSSMMSKAANPMEAYYRFDFQHWLPDNILNKVDRMTMAHGLEARVPYLDYRLVEFLASLPQNLKLRKGSGKFLLKELYDTRYRPPERAKAVKRAFFMPMSGAFHDAYIRFIESSMSDFAVNSDVFNLNQIKKLRKLASAHELLFDKQILSVAMFNVWLKAVL